MLKLMMLISKKLLTHYQEKNQRMYNKYILNIQVVKAGLTKVGGASFGGGASSGKPAESKKDDKKEAAKPKEAPKPAPKVEEKEESFEGGLDMFG